MPRRAAAGRSPRARNRSRTGAAWPAASAVREGTVTGSIIGRTTADTGGTAGRHGGHHPGFQALQLRTGHSSAIGGADRRGRGSMRPSKSWGGVHGEVRGRARWRRRVGPGRWSGGRASRRSGRARLPPALGDRRGAASGRARLADHKLTSAVRAPGPYHALLATRGRPLGDQPARAFFRSVARRSPEGIFPGPSVRFQKTRGAAIGGGGM